MKLLWTPIVVAAVVTLAGCGQSSLVGPSAETSPLPNTLEGPLTALAGNGAPRGKHVFSFNLIGTPGNYNGGCGDGRRIFVNRNVQNASILVRDDNDGWHIEDCNATGVHRAELHTDQLGIYDIYVRILGKPGGTLHICASTVFETDNTLCLLDTIELTREAGKEKFEIQSKTLFNADGQDVFWAVDTNSDFRIAQFRVYQVS